MKWIIKKIKCNVISKASQYSGLKTYVCPYKVLSLAFSFIRSQHILDVSRQCFVRLLHKYEGKINCAYYLDVLDVC